MLLFGGYAHQTIGLQTTSPSTSAFITGLYVVFTPIVEVARAPAMPPVGRSRWDRARNRLASTCSPAPTSRFGAGELWTLCAPSLFAVWIVYQGEYARALDPDPVHDGADASWSPCSACPPTAAHGVGDLTGLAVFAAAFTGIACSSVALSLQVYGQRRIAPSRAALILLSEPVFAAVAGFVNGERLGAVELVGAAVILARHPDHRARPGPSPMPHPEIVEPHPF